MDLSLFTHVVTDLEGAVTFLMIYSLSFLFTAQVFAWVTPPKPKFVNAIALGMGAGAFVVYVIYNYIPLAPAIIEASITGVYGIPGYFWTFTILFLILIFIMNTINSWDENRPLEVIQ